VAVLPFVEGQSFSWGESFPMASRLAVIDMLVAGAHRPRPRRGGTRRRKTSPSRTAMSLELAMAAGGAAPDCGPYARSARAAPGRQRGGRQAGSSTRYEQDGRPPPTLAAWSSPMGEPQPGAT